MINEGQYDPMEEASDTSLMHCFDGSPTVYRWLLNQEEFFIDLEQRIGELTMSAAQAMSPSSNGSKCLEELIAHGTNLNHAPRQDLPFLEVSLVYYSMCVSPIQHDTIDFPKRFKVLWDAGADIHMFKHHKTSGISLASLFDFIQVMSTSKRTEKSTLSQYDRLDDSSIIEHRPRTSRSLWHTWYPGYELSIMEITQRWLDAWMEVLFDAGLDIIDYGRREDQLHPKGIVYSYFRKWSMEARVYFEYGNHIGGCRIHVTEVWLAEDPAEKNTTTAEDSTMPGSWDFDDK